MPGQLEGKTALITGAARGQGRSHAVRLAQEGANIIALDICRQIESVAYPMGTADDLRQTTAAVENLGRSIVAREVDVRDHRCVGRGAAVCPHCELRYPKELRSWAASTSSWPTPVSA